MATQPIRTCSPRWPASPIAARRQGIIETAALAAAALRLLAAEGDSVG